METKETMNYHDMILKINNLREQTSLGTGMIPDWLSAVVQMGDVSQTIHAIWTK